MHADRLKRKPIKKQKKTATKTFIASKACSDLETELIQENYRPEIRRINF